MERGCSLRGRRLPHAADIISDISVKQLLLKTEIASVECPGSLQLRCGFYSELNYPF